MLTYMNFKLILSRHSFSQDRLSVSQTFAEITARLNTNNRHVPRKIIPEWWRVIISYSKAQLRPIPVAAQSKAKVCGCSPAEIVGSNPAGVMDISLVWVLCYHGQVSAMSWSLIQRSPTDCGATLCVIHKLQKWRAHRPRWAERHRTKRERERTR